MQLIRVTSPSCHCICLLRKVFRLLMGWTDHNVRWFDVPLSIRNANSVVSSKHDGFRHQTHHPLTKTCYDHIGLVKRASLTPVQQLEQTQILNILLDDAGKDWKPRDKTPKQPVHKHAAKGGKQARKAPVPQKTGAQKAALVQNAQKSGAAPAVAAKPAPALVKRASLTPVQQAEQQQILNILIDDAGKDWKPRDKSMATCGIS
ncbi:hypothetical protein AaE_003954 [Aphanomyces astaci]|uniref:Uncharacterized protein n=1 Tax=Aphanomyces astaci TaxID=112090 RepID=A0A6A5AQE2_APHAT|nr:hypothetical protein AaE_003954 [Aphanomyces astaci]